MSGRRVSIGPATVIDGDTLAICYVTANLDQFRQLNRVLSVRKIGEVFVVKIECQRR